VTLASPSKPTNSLSTWRVCRRPRGGRLDRAGFHLPWTTSHQRPSENETLAGFLTPAMQALRGNQSRPRRGRVTDPGPLGAPSLPARSRLRNQFASHRTCPQAACGGATPKLTGGPPSADEVAENAIVRIRPRRLTGGFASNAEATDVARVQAVVPWMERKGIGSLLVAHDSSMAEATATSTARGGEHDC